RYVASGHGARHVAARVQATLLGRLLIGPVLAVLALVADEVRRLLRRPDSAVRDWLPHLALVVPIVAWLEWTGFGTLRYLLLVVYP
ncbi:hypothetical protein LXJ56_26650, partial [Escherichia coli]|nr:hypothetical protein [Escherichia coli]